MSKRMNLSEQVRQAVERSGMSRYAICKHIGLEQSGMSRFMSGKAGLSMKALDRLAELLNLNITQGPRTLKGK